jgi:hypothetical protein
VEKGTNTEPIHVTPQEDVYTIEVRTFLDVGIQIMEIPSVLTNINSLINTTTPMHEEDTILKVILENVASTIREIHATKTLYRHPNHENRVINRLVYQHHSKRKHLTYYPNNIYAGTIESHNNQLSWKFYKCNIPQRIELVWSYPFTVHQLCSTLRSSYNLISSTITTSRTKNQAKAVQARAKT